MRTGNWLVYIATAALVLGHEAAAQVPFALSCTLTNGSFIGAVTFMDANNDGKPDIISIRSSTANRLYVWTNAGNGLFASNASYAVGSFPWLAIAADVNNDGKSDLITANNSGNSLTVLTNDGNGGFALSQTVAMGSGSSPHGVAAADLFGRGHLDLVSANSQAARVVIWTNTGAGGIFASNTSFSIGTPQFEVPESVTVADMNGDGKPDILCGGSDFSPCLFMWTNNGVGGFAAAPVPFISDGVYWVTTPDVNGDGRPDLVLVDNPVTATTGHVLVYTNNGSGGLILSGNYPVGPPSSIQVLPADVNGDEMVDLIANTGGNSLTLLTNTGYGTFGSNESFTMPSGKQPFAVADINGDGRMDLIVGSANSPGTISVLTNASTFMPRLTLKRSGTNFIVSWPAIWPNWTLQQNTNLNTGWFSFSGTIGNDGITKTVTNTIPTANRFFRLSNP